MSVEDSSNRILWKQQDFNKVTLQCSPINDSLLICIVLSCLHSPYDVELRDWPCSRPAGNVEIDTHYSISINYHCIDHVHQVNSESNADLTCLGRKPIDLNF